MTEYAAGELTVVDKAAPEPSNAQAPEAAGAVLLVANASQENPVRLYPPLPRRD